MFQIQVGYPTLVRTEIGGVSDFSEIFLKIYRENDESFYILWSDIPVRFRYGRELFVNFDEIFSMIWMLVDQSEGKATINLKNQLLSIQLSLLWQDTNLSVCAEFSTKFLEYDKYVESLNKHRKIGFDKAQYLAEWHTLIHQIALSFNTTKVISSHGLSLSKLEKLNILDRKIHGFGSMYEALP